MQLPKSKQFFYSCLLFLIGVGLGEMLDFPAEHFLIAASVCLLLFLFFKRFRLEVFFIFIFALGIFWPNFCNPNIDSGHISYYNGQTKEFSAVITVEPRQKETGWELVVSPDEFKGNVIAQIPLFPEYEYDDRLKIKCGLEAPGKIEEFDYGKYLAVQGIYSSCRFADIRFIEHDAGNAFMAAILRSKQYFIAKINATLPEPQSGLLNGILIGDRSGISSDLKNDFSATGVSHIVAVSGYNITIVVAVIIALFNALRINRKKSFWLVVAMVVVFVILTGASASVMRAGIMGIIVLIAKQSGRKGNVRNVLALTAFAMVFANPKILLWDAGFQLSFLSTLGLIYLSPVLTPYFKFVPEKFSLRENLSTTMSAIIATLPLIMFNFHRVSLVAPIVNILVLPAIPLSMLTGAIQLGCAMVWLDLGMITGWFSWLLLTYVIKTVTFFAGLPFAMIDFRIGGMMMVAMYGGIAGFVWWDGRRRVKFQNSRSKQDPNADEIPNSQS